MSQDIKKIQQAYDQFIESGQVQEMIPWLDPCPKMTKERSLQIYRNNYITSLVKTLGDTYPACSQLLGEDIFQRLSLEYIAKNKSLAPLLSSYGNYFPELLTTSPLNREIPFLSELARYEKTLRDIILSEIISPFVFSSPHPVSEIWSLLTYDLEEELPPGDHFQYLIRKTPKGCTTLPY